MADDKSKRTQQDRAQVNVNESYEVDYLAKKFNVSADQVRQAEAKVGKSRQKVEEYLTQNK